MLLAKVTHCLLFHLYCIAQVFVSMNLFSCCAPVFLSLSYASTIDWGWRWQVWYCGLEVPWMLLLGFT